MAKPFPTLFANANPDMRDPTVSEQANGFACGPADPDLFDRMFNRLQEAVNNLAAQLTAAGVAVDVVWAETDANALDNILKTYQIIIKSDLVLNVPADYDDIADAMDYLSNFRIANTATVIVNVAAGTYNHGTKVISGHPDGLRIRVVGPALPSGMVVDANFQTTGYSGANIATDRIVNDTMLKGRFPVVILTTNSAVEVGTSDITFENILFVGSGSNNGLGTTGGLIKGTNVAVHNYAYGYLVDGDGMIDVPGCTASGNTVDGFAISFAGTIKATGSVSAGNNGAGFSTSVGGTIQAPSAVAKGNGDAAKGGFFASLAGWIQARAATAKNNAGSGFLVTNDGFIQARESASNNNGLYGYSIFNGGRLNAAESTSGSNASGDYRVMSFGGMTITGYGGTAVCSPTANTIGNGNGYIKN